MTYETFQQPKKQWRELKGQQDGRLARAYLSPNYKYFDQLLQTGKIKTTVLNLVFKEFLPTSIPPLISLLYAKGYNDFHLKNFFLTVPKKFVQEPFCVSEKFWYRKMLGIKEGRVSRFSVKTVLFHSAEKFRTGTLLSSRKFLVSTNNRDKRGGGYHDFPSKLFCLTVLKNFVEEPFLVSENFWYRKKLGMREGAGITIFSQNCFVLQCWKIS